MSLNSARIRADAINITIINMLSARRALLGNGTADRAAPGAGRAPMELVEITEVYRSPEGPEKDITVNITAPGMPATRKRTPSVLAGFQKHDVQRVAADRYAMAVEKIGSMGGASAEGGTVDGGQASNDGGVTTRIEYAAIIRAVDQCLAGLPPVLRPRPCGPKHRRDITAPALMRSICVEGLDVRSILHNAGWSGQSRDARTLNTTAADLLTRMAQSLGLIDKPKALS